ncbi:14509_t:CDS:1, partial [Cetraspora pellucida]
NNAQSGLIKSEKKPPTKKQAHVDEQSDDMNDLKKRFDNLNLGTSRPRNEQVNKTLRKNNAVLVAVIYHKVNQLIEQLDARPKSVTGLVDCAKLVA